jgi:hypothetical protein
MEMERNCLGNYLGNFGQPYENERRLFGQPLMEMVDNRFIQPKQVTQHSMQPL